MSEKAPDGWTEPINRGLWQYETLFGAPRWMVFVHLSLAPLLMFSSISWVYLLAGLQFVATMLTRTEPEWPQIIWDFFAEPSDVEP